MRIGVIGGISRQEPQLARRAAHGGHVVEFHVGNVHGRGASELRALVARSEVVVIVTDHNSHGGVQIAKRLARQLKRTSIVLSRCGVARFGALLDALEARERYMRGIDDAPLTRHTAATRA